MECKECHQEWEWWAEWWVEVAQEEVVVKWAQSAVTKKEQPVDLVDLQTLVKVEACAVVIKRLLQVATCLKTMSYSWLTIKNGDSTWSVSSVMIHQSTSKHTLNTLSFILLLDLELLHQHQHQNRTQAHGVEQAKNHQVVTNNLKWLNSSIN